MSEHLDKALALIGSYDEETIELVTTCGVCGDKVDPQIDGDGVALRPFCDDCKAEQLLWAETHCDDCREGLPRVALQWGDSRYCAACAAEYRGMIH